jgi:hypothetical protein
MFSQLYSRSVQRLFYQLLLGLEVWLETGRTDAVATEAYRSLLNDALVGF